MSEIKILYVDDSLETQLSKYLCENLSDILSDDQKRFAYSIVSEDYAYDNITYEEFIKDERVKNSKLLIIDSRLFTDNNAGDKITGQAIKMLIQRTYPYKEVIIISQNSDINSKIDYISKFKRTRFNKGDYIKFYNDKLLQHIKLAIKEIISNEQVLQEIRENKFMDSSLIDDIESLIEGSNEYGQLKKQDIDDLIDKFNHLIEEYKDE